MPRSIYFDYNATTPLDSNVRDAMMPFLDELWGNPSSVHHVGRRARAHLDDARDRAAHFLGCKPSELIFTSGGTESVNLAIFGIARLLRSKGRHIITSSIEHNAVLHSCQFLAQYEGFELSLIPVDSTGLVDMAALEKLIRPDTILVSVMAANNEIGTIQPVAEIGNLCRQKGVLFHTDAVQWFGKQPFDTIHQFNADLVSICGHKFHGPKGAGALFIKSPLQPFPILFGGGHENERRAGTENLPSVIGFVEALTRFVKTPVFDREQLRPLTAALRKSAQSIEGVHLVGSQDHSLCNTVSFVVERTDSIVLMAGLDMEGVCASSGSACSAGSLEPSHVIKALGYSDSLANALVRFSLGRDSSESEVQFVSEVLPYVIHRAQRLDKASKSL
jgi:Cysteine sulfinate desulfinase/cysteine desulfurase and related enzymes